MRYIKFTQKDRDEMAIGWYKREKKRKDRIKQNDIKFFKQVYGSEWEGKYKIFLKEKRK